MMICDRISQSKTPRNHCDPTFGAANIGRAAYHPLSPPSPALRTSHTPNFLYAIMRLRLSKNNIMVTINDPLHRRNQNQNHPYTKMPRRLLEAKLHEAICMAREQIAVREVSGLTGRGDAE